MYLLTIVFPVMTTPETVTSELMEPYTEKIYKTTEYLVRVWLTYHGNAVAVRARITTKHDIGAPVDRETIILPKPINPKTET